MLWGPHETAGPPVPVVVGCFPGEATVRGIRLTRQRGRQLEVNPGSAGVNMSDGRGTSAHTDCSALRE